MPSRALAGEAEIVQQRRDELKPGGALHQTLFDWAATQYAGCGISPRLSGTNDLPDNRDVWPFFGVVDGPGVWIWNPILDIRYDPHDLDTQVITNVTTTITTIPSVLPPFMNYLVAIGLQIRTMPLDGTSGLFVGLDTLRTRLSAARARVQAYYDSRQTDSSGKRMPDWADRTDVPYVESIRVTQAFPDGVCSSGEVIELWDSSFPFMEHIGALYEFDRVSPILDQMAAWLNYHYLRQQTLPVWDCLIAGHLALQSEQCDIALAQYQKAIPLIDTLLVNVARVASRRPAGAGYVMSPGSLYNWGLGHLERVMTLGDALEPEASVSDLYNRPWSVYLMSFSDSHLQARLTAMLSSTAGPILDGDLGAPLEDALHYLRDFAIPALRGEAYLRQADYGGPADCDLAITAFEQAAAYLPADGASVAARFLWLRMARAYLRKGELLHLHNDWQGASDALDQVLQDTFAAGRVRVSSTVSVNGEDVDNPLVAAVRLDAARRKKQLEDAVNAMGYPEGYLPSLRYDWLIAQAGDSAEQLSRAEERYVTLRCAAEDAAARSLSLGIWWKPRRRRRW